MSNDTQEDRVLFGTFLGVFTPSILTILGAIMYLRFGWVVGTAGLPSTLLIVILANAITLVTALSVSTLATNMRVGVGGAYFLISRSLGLEMGGAIGLPLYLSQTISLTLYCYALAETLGMLIPGLPLMPVAAFFVVGVTAFASRSTLVALKAQVFILVAVAVSMVSLFACANWGGSMHTATAYAGSGGGFWHVFAVFFPAVTGILTGLGLSGDLKDPERSLPLGTLSAVGVGMVAYIAIPLALSTHSSAEALRENPLVWLEVAAIPWVVIPGLFTAILSSALGSVLAAPRTLQALAEDGILPEALGKTENGEPRLASRISGGVALVAVLLGDLNSVATVVTLFFLTTYGLINLVATLEELVGNPSFRPRIRVAWPMALGAAFACFGVMFLINPLASALAISIELVIYGVLSRRVLTAAWGDMRAGIHMTAARWLLLRNKAMSPHPRNWRPHILVFTSDLEKNIQLVRVALAFSQNRGIVTVASLIVSDGDDVLPKMQHRIDENHRLLQRHRLRAFYETDFVRDVESGMLTVAQANGIAGLQSNTVLIGWPDRHRLVTFVRVMRRLNRLGKSVLIVRLIDKPLPRRRRIDLWWSGRAENGDLMLLLAYLLTLGEGWRRARIQMKTIVDSPEERDERLAALRTISEETRIRFHPEVIVHDPGEPVQDTIRRHSVDAALVILGLGMPNQGEEETFAAHLESLVEGLPNTVLVRNAGPFRGELL